MNIKDFHAYMVGWMACKIQEKALNEGAAPLW
jgi:hypothetical protein